MYSAFPRAEITDTDSELVIRNNSVEIFAPERRATRDLTASKNFLLMLLKVRVIRIDHICGVHIFREERDRIINLVVVQILKDGIGHKLRIGAVTELLDRGLGEFIEIGCEYLEGHEEHEK